MLEAGQLLGLFNVSPEEWFAGDIPAAVTALVEARVAARAAKDFAASDRLRDEIAALGYAIEDGPRGAYKLRKA